MVSNTICRTTSSYRCNAGSYNGVCIVHTFPTRVDAVLHLLNTLHDSHTIAYNKSQSSTLVSIGVASQLRCSLLCEEQKSQWRERQVAMGAQAA